MALTPQLQGGTPFLRGQTVDPPPFQLGDRLSSPLAEAEFYEYEFSQVEDVALPDWTDAPVFSQLEDGTPGFHRWTADLPFLQLEASLRDHGKP